jgi:two-component system nitrogen regulation response regulator GlnG
MAPGETITAFDLQGALSTVAAPATQGVEWDQALAAWAKTRLDEGTEGLHAEARERLDRTLLEVALQFTHGRRAEAASKLGVGRNTVTRKLGPGRKRR